MNEWFPVRREERAIYTSRQKSTVQICVGSFDTDRRNFRRLRKALFKRAVHLVDSSRVGTADDCRHFRQPALSARVGTFDGWSSWAPNSQGPESSGRSRDFRQSAPLASIGTSDGQNSKNYIQVFVRCLSVSLLILFLCLSTLSSRTI